MIKYCRTDYPSGETSFKLTMHLILRFWGLTTSIEVLRPHKGAR